MSIIIDLKGNTYGDLKVIDLAFDEAGKKKKWLCECKCGEKTIVSGSNLRSGKTQRCKKCGLKVSASKRKVHGKTNTKLYNVWNTMLTRCHNPNSKSYNYYGRKGIVVCEEWHEAKKFFEWAKNNGYKEGLEIDRINTEGNYCPNNCRWVKRLQNSNNKSNNKVLEHNGETKTLAEWARYFGVNYKNLSRNIIKGYSLIEAVNREKNNDKTHRVRRGKYIAGGEE